MDGFSLEFDRYVQHLPTEDQDILREHFVPTLREYRERGHIENVTEVIQQIIKNRDRGLPERRLRKITRIVQKAIEFREVKLLPFQPSGSPVLIPADEESSVTNINGEGRASVHKTEGNNFFKANRFREAIACYSRAILIDPSNAVYFGNRSLCYLKIGMFEDALFDSEKALSFDPLSLKYRHRLAMAWSGLGDHEKSCATLEGMCNVSNEIQAVLEKEQRLLGNTKGVFDLLELEGQVKRGEDTLIADYLGPVSIEYIGDRGYALFARRLIKRGEIISVSKAAAFTRAATYPTEDLNNINRESRAGRLIRSLSDTAKQSKLASHRVFNLHFRDRNPIQCQLYSSSGYQLIRGRENALTSSSDLERLFRYCSYSVSCSPRDAKETEEPIGIWYIPSFINHSCLPTANQRFIGDISIVRANRDLAAHSEITLSYVSVYGNLTEKDRGRELRERWNFTCGCELCEFERDPINRELIVRSVQLRDRAIRLSSLSNNPLLIIGPNQYQLLVQVIGLAGEMKLGIDRFNAAVWHSIVSLTKLRVAPSDSSVYYELIDKIKPFICQLELTHQLFFWDNCISYFQYIQLPDRNNTILDIQARQAEVKSNLINILYK